MSSLRRELGQSGATAISTGLAFAAINFLAVAQLLGHVDARWAWAPVLVAGLVMLLVRGLFAELDGMRPSAAGIRLWLAAAMPGRAALIVTMTYMTTVVLVIAADAYIIGEAIAWATGSGRVLAIVYVAVLLGVATWINLRGIRIAGLAEQVATYTVLGLTLLVGVLMIAHPGPGPGTTAAPDGSLLQALVLGIFLYVGFEWVTTNSEEVTRPQVIPRAMLSAVLLLGVCWAVFATGAGMALRDDQLASAYPQLLAAEAAIGRAGMLLMLFVTGMTAINTFNGGFATLSRFVYALARENKLPASLATLNDRAVPVVPVVFLGVASVSLAVLVAVTGAFDVMVSLGATLEAGIYAAAAYSVYRLRRSAPDAARPHRFRGNAAVVAVLGVVFGVLALAASTTVGTDFDVTPLLVVLGFAAVVTVWVVVGVPRLERRAAAVEAERRAARAAARAARASARATRRPE